MIIRSILAILLIAASALAAAQTKEVTAAAIITPATTRVDGSPLAPEDIKHHKLYYAIGAQPTAQSPFVVVDGTAIVVTLELSPRAEPYEVYFTATTVDTGDRESAMTAPEIVRFRVASTSPPGSPVQVQVKFTCAGDCELIPLE